MRGLRGCAAACCGFATVLFLVLPPRPAAAQRDSITVVAGARYRAGPLHRFLLGRGYRDAWTAPVRVEVLDLSTFAGGLTPLRRGGGRQTRSLRLRGADGRDYSFRSVDKDITAGLHPRLRQTFWDWLRQDQISAQHPAAPLAADPLLRAAGILHPEPHLAVMPDDPGLGGFRAEFGGMLGTIEVHAAGPEDGVPGFAGAEDVVDTEEMLERLGEGPGDRVDSRAYLATRLMDVFLGDPDRHEGQYRWALFTSDGVRRWVAVPEDRDYAFVDYGGVLVGMARSGLDGAVKFRGEYPTLKKLTFKAESLDRRLLADVPRPVWDSVAATLRVRLTDSVIAAAVGRLPPEYRVGRGGELAGKLRARRDRLPEFARRFYAHLATEVEVHATGAAEVAEVDRSADGSVEVRLYPREPGSGAPAGEPYFRRAFRRGETRKVRVHLHGGDDRVVARGAADGSVRVRVIRGGVPEARRAPVPRHRGSLASPPRGPPTPPAAPRSAAPAAPVAWARRTPAGTPPA